MPLARGAHDVVENRSQFQNFETALAEIAITAHIAITKSQNVPELMRERPRGQIAGTQSDIASDEAVRRLSAGRQHSAVFRKFRHVGSHIEVSAALCNRRHTPEFDLKGINRVVLPRL